MKEKIRIKKRLVFGIVLTSLSYLVTLALILSHPWFASFRLVFAFVATIIFSNILSQLVTKGEEV